jgi:hypothetical protein
MEEVVQKRKLRRKSESAVTSSSESCGVPSPKKKEKTSYW